MRRIGLVASKIAQGNLIKYNFFVVIIATLCALMFLVVCGLSTLIALFLISLVLRHFFPSQFPGAWVNLVNTCMAVLVAFVMVLNLLAIVKNVRLTKPKS